MPLASACPTPSDESGSKAAAASPAAIQARPRQGLSTCEPAGLARGPDVSTQPESRVAVNDVCLRRVIKAHGFIAADDSASASVIKATTTPPGTGALYHQPSETASISATCSSVWPVGTSRYALSPTCALPARGSPRRQPCRTLEDGFHC